MLAATMAEYVSRAAIQTVPDEVVERTIDLVISASGSAILGLGDPIASTMVGHVLSRGGLGEASVIGAGYRAPVELAAMANATLAHVTEYEDVSWPEGQYTCNVIPALLSVADAIGASGGDVIAAIVAGFEVASQPALATEGSIMGRGFLNSSCMGTIGVAAGAARLMGLDSAGIGRAITLSASLAGGLLRQTGSAAHVLEAGFSARAGVEAAQLASRGMGGMGDIFDGERGFFSTHAGRSEVAFVPPTGSRHRIMAVGQKKYPCGYRMQRLLDGILGIMARERLTGKDIASCAIHVNGGFLRYVRFPDPANGEEARLSLPHCVAAGLARGRVDIGAFQPSALHDPAILDQRRHLELVEHPEWGDEMIAPFELVVMRTHDGRQFDAECRVAHGDSENPLSREETAAKFRRCTDGLLGGAGQTALLEMLADLARLPSLSPLMRTLANTGSGDSVQ